MPLFEYKCNDCSQKFEVLVKSSAHEKEVTCPSCKSVNHKKLFSSFSASVSGSATASFGGCSDGSCGIPSSSSGCSSGMCGLN